jgi:hypothetical protein
MELSVAYSPAVARVHSWFYSRRSRCGEPLMIHPPTSSSAIMKSGDGRDKPGHDEGEDGGAVHIYHPCAALSRPPRQ